MNSNTRYSSRLSFRFFLILLIASFSLNNSASAYWVWSPESGKFVNPEGSAGEDTAAQQYNTALGLYEARNYDKAEDAFKELTKKYPNSHAAPEALFKLANIYEEQNEFYKAFRTYQRLIDNYPQSTHVNEVVERQFRIGNVFLSGKRPKFMGVPVLPAMPKAIEVFEQVVKNAPYSGYGDKSLFNAGIAYKRSGNAPRALDSFQKLIENYPDSPLVPDAKFQLGEVSLDMTRNMNRSQEGLESAESYFDNFLEEYPDTNVKDKALSMKKQIDEKNAEKNYKIGEYYEKENYLDSAIIYYEDVVKNSPDTSWAAKAKEKLAMFRSPVTYIKEQEDALEAELERVELRRREVREKISGLPDSAAAEKGQLEESLKALDKTEKQIKSNMRSFGHRKVTDIRRRYEALKRKTAELKEKKKTLTAKKKMMRNNPSEDLKQAFASWTESLRAEELALEREKAELERIGDELGVKPRVRMPFKRKEKVEEIKKMNVDRLTELVEQKRLWEIKKEELYEYRTELATQLDSLQGEDIEILSQKNEFREMLEKNGGALKEKQQRLAGENAAVQELEKRLKAKQAELEKAGGSGVWSQVLKAPQAAVKRSWDLMTFSSDDPKEKLIEAREKEARLTKAIADKKQLVAAIQESFKALPVSKEPAASQPAVVSPESAPIAAPTAGDYKKKMKLIEREMRWRYDEVQDRGRAKKGKVDELEALLKESQTGNSVLTKTGRAVAAPAVGTYKFFDAFLFGLKQKEEVVRTQALAAQAKTGENPDDRIQSLRKEIELESLLIEARAREIQNLQNELKALRKKATEEDNGFSYRSAFIDRPGHFVKDAVVNARKIFPTKERNEILIDKLDKETRELAKLEEQKAALAVKIQEFERETSAAPAAEIKPQEPAAAPAATPDVQALEKEFQSLKTEFEAKENAYRESRKQVQNELRQFYRENLSKRLEERFSSGSRELRDQKKLFNKEREKAEEEILKIIKREEKLVRQQQSLISDKKKKMESKIAELKKKEDYRSEVLENEMTELLEQSKEVQTQQQNLMEEKKRMSDVLKGEVQALEK